MFLVVSLVFNLSTAFGLAFVFGFGKHVFMCIVLQSLGFSFSCGFGFAFVGFQFRVFVLVFVDLVFSGSSQNY